MTTARGFDISHHNAVADFPTAKAAGYRFVYLKATQGAHYTDPTFAPRAVDARADSLPVGAYLFLEPDQPVTDQVVHFIEVAGDLDLIPALDHETRSARGPAATLAAAVAAVNLLERHYGEPPVLYCDRSFIVEGLTAGLGRCPLWIADYSGGTGLGRHAGAVKTAYLARLAAAHRGPGTPTKPHTARAGTRPHIPTGPWTDYAIWQTGQVQVPGVAGGDGPGTDVNVCPDLSRIIRHVPTPPHPTPTPMPAIQEDRVLVIRAKGRTAAIVDSAGIGHPIGSPKWSAVNHTADKGAAVDIVTLDDPADWDAYVPAAEGKKVDHEAYNPFVHPTSGQPLTDRTSHYPVRTVNINNITGPEA